MRDDNLTRDGETKPRAFALRRKKWVENALADLVGDPSASIQMRVTTPIPSASTVTSIAPPRVSLIASRALRSKLRSAWRI